MTSTSVISFLQALIQHQSLSGQEQDIVRRIEAEMHALGYDRVFVDSNGSLIGIVDSGKAGPTILLDAHCDTVGITTPQEWSKNPFAGQIEGGRMYGRGTSDMKGALAAMVYAAGTVNRGKIEGRVAVSVTVMEEVMEGRSLEVVLKAVKPDCVVIGESTDLNLNHGGRGRAEILLEATGKPAHSSNPQVGINAIHAMIRAIQAVETLALGSDPLLGKAIMVLTDIISNPYPGYSVIPSRCYATYDRRLLVGETIESVLGSLEELPYMDNVHVKVVEGTHTTYTDAVLEGPKFFPAWKIEADHPFVQQALTGLRGSGLDPRLSAYSFCTNAASSAGVFGIPTVGFGPSKESLAHIIDEYIEIDALMAAGKGYQGIIESVLQPS